MAHQQIIELEDSHVAAILAKNPPGTDGEGVRQTNPDTGKPYTDAEWAFEWLRRYCDQQLEGVELPATVETARQSYVRSATARIVKPEIVTR